MKNVLIGIMAAGAITAGAQAQKAPDTQQDVQSKVATTVGATRLGNQDAVSL